MQIEQQQRENVQQDQEYQSQSHRRIMVPPIHYPLERIPSSEMRDNFTRLTASGCFPTDDAKTQANAFLDHVSKFSNQMMWTFGYIPAPPHSDITRRVIGKDGHYFKMTTILSEVNFIWHNRVRNTFLFWGATTFQVVKAMNAIRWRIHKVYSTPPPPPPRLPYQQYQIEDISDEEEEEEEEEEKEEKEEKKCNCEACIIKNIMGEQATVYYY